VKRKYDIILTGIPIGGLARTTPETLSAFKAARVVFDLSSHQTLLKRYCKRVVNLDKEYWTGDLDELVYKRIADKILEEARNGPGVVLVVDGHPSIFQDLSWDVLHRGNRRGLRVQILPAVSCIDAMAAFCKLELNARGLQIFEATSLLAFNGTLNPYVDAIIMQIGWFGTSLLYNTGHSKKGRFAPLVMFLTKYYPETHRVKLLRAPALKNEPAKIITTKLSLLDSFHKSISMDMTLFLPALESEMDTAINEDFLQQTEEKDHLMNIANLE